jgi:hypothetical protein
MNLYLAMLAFGSFNWLVTRRELREPITLKKFKRAS